MSKKKRIRALEREVAQLRADVAELRRVKPEPRPPVTFFGQEIPSFSLPLSPENMRYAI